MVGLGAAPAVAQFGILVFLPETPRWLLKAGKTEQARAVLVKVYGIGLLSVAESVIRDIDKEIMDEEEATSKRRHHVAPGKDAWPWLTRLQDGSAELFGVGGNRRALTIACLLQGLQQLCGFVRNNSLSQGGHVLTVIRTPSCTSRRPYSRLLASRLPPWPHCQSPSRTSV